MTQNTIQLANAQRPGIPIPAEPRHFLVATAPPWIFGPLKSLFSLYPGIQRKPDLGKPLVGIPHSMIVRFFNSLVVSFLLIASGLVLWLTIDNRGGKTRVFGNCVRLCFRY